MVACQKTPQNTLSLKKSRVEFPYTIDTMDVVVRSNNPWAALSNSDWCTVLPSPCDSVLRLAVVPNKTPNLRQTTILVTSADLSASFIALQNACPAPDYYRHEDSLAMIEIYNNCGGENWKTIENFAPVPTWEPNKPITSWRGVATALIDNSLRVRSISLQGAGLKGRLPRAINNLSELNALFLGGNTELQSPIEVLSHQMKLEVLDLSSASYEIQSIDELGALENLVFLNLDGAKINQSWLAQMAEMKKLQYLSLVGCGIERGVPQQFRGLTHLSSLNLSDNPLKGPIPAWINELVNLEELDLSLCLLVGEIPNSICDLTRLKTFKAGLNFYNGSLPSDIGRLTKLEVLNLSECGLLGQIPPTIGNLSELTYLDLSFNYIEGQIPVEIANLSRLESLILTGNRLSGTIDRAIVESKLWKGWWPSSLICPQQTGSGFTNCDKINNQGNDQEWKDESSGGYIGRR
ncbi:MAG: hypothetical protein RR872_01170 [Mucinivorans sp.]